MEPPPLLPDLEEKLKSYLLCVDSIPLHEYERNQEYWPRKPNCKSLFHYETSPLSTTLKVQRDLNTGEIKRFEEVAVRNAGATPKNSMSLERAPAPPSETIRGNVAFYPFWPGGIPEPPKIPKVDTTVNTDELLVVPPGFTTGIVFEDDCCTVTRAADKQDSYKERVTEPPVLVDLHKLIEEEEQSLKLWDSGKEMVHNYDKQAVLSNLPEEEEVVPKEVPILKISEEKPVYTKSNEQSTQWAILLDSTKPVPNFEKQVPEMARTYPFELDPFQKLAILHLEKKDHVFVAAHTSAGKTVVAEYAIALSQQHMTKTIYTSPIKALSNQKYRDFKDIFDDVGLVTGDFQINQTASCLIMTTEILRSMLYNASDIIRDLEFVVFDEVHYINDKERGHVWEQVLIMLPKYVCVILLSATVPNYLEFADWLGTTYQKKVYVISTYQRPVPLRHYLYTGREKQLFLIRDAEGGFLLPGYVQAKESLTKKAPKVQPDKDKKKKPQFIKEPYRPNPNMFGEKQERTLLYDLIHFLNKQELLPVVIFVFSRVKCDRNARLLTGLDLTTAREKGEIHVFFEKCVKTLKEPDRNIRQIVEMRDILERGIGVHHSGILPILKEIVEMLFQEGLLKVLFATETFAMGVNMPTRTVVFHSINKHDGQSRRNLRPAEYIQMAGRAGRRNHDKEGTVIILCKGEVPHEKELTDMMLGKPDALISKFRLTYGMILSLLRVERLPVESMMSRSFRENKFQKKAVQLETRLKEVQEKLNLLNSEDLASYLQPLVKYYEWASHYLELREEIWKCCMLLYGKNILTPGRIVLITHKEHMNKPGLILSCISVSKLTYKVLVLIDEKEGTKNVDRDPDWYRMLALARDKAYIPMGSVGHTIITVTALDIFEISGKEIKLDTEIIIKDYDKRQMERFKNDPPCTSCTTAIQELLRLSVNNELAYQHLINDFKINEQQIYQDLQVLYKEKDKLIDFLPYVSTGNFEHNFEKVFERMHLEDEKRKLEYSLSFESMSLHPEYMKRIEILKHFNFVDEQKKVLMKGQVACKMSVSELLITELIYENKLNILSAAEAAALLSVFAFQGKKREREPEENYEEVLPHTLLKAMKELEEMHSEIAALELRYQIGEESENLSFQLVPIVYEWALQKPFSEIMDLTTELQEGIIVRCIQQLSEIINDVRQAAAMMGVPELGKKMEEASSAIKRDIVFAASLYTQNEMQKKKL